MIHDEMWARINRVKAQGFQIERHLMRLQSKGYWIGFITIRLSSCQDIYPLYTTNKLASEKHWQRIRDKFEAHIQEWLENVFRGNTRTRKRRLDAGWELIGRWERGKNGFLHIHGHIAIYIGDNSALRDTIEDLLTRFSKETYHPAVSKIDIREWKGPGSKSMKYIAKEAWRANSGEKTIFARASENVIRYDRPTP